MKKTKKTKTGKRRLDFGRLFDNSQFTVIISILIAVFGWLVVSLVIEPNTQDKVTGIPVDLDYNAQTLQSMGLDVVSEEETPRVSVRVEGERAVVGGLEADDITVYPRLSNVTEAGQYELTLVAVKNDPNASYEIREIIPSTITVRFATLTQKKFVVETDTSGVKPADGYILTGAYATPGEVTLTGPEEEIQSVGRVVAKVGIEEELTSTRIATGELIIYDKNDNPITSKLISVDAQTVEVTIPILQKKTLPLTVGYTNIPDGFDLSLLKPTFEYESINLAGPADSIQNKTELQLGYIDLQREFTLNFVKSFPITLDAGYQNLDNMNEVTVSFDTSAFSQKTVTVSDIRVVNQAANREVQVLTSRIYDVTIIGLSNDVAALRSSSVIAEIDAGDLSLSEGQQTVPVTIRIPGSTTVFATGSYTALVETKLAS